MHQVTKLSALGFLSILGWGCAVGPELSAAKVSVPDAYRGLPPGRKREAWHYLFWRSEMVGRIPGRDSAQP